MRKTASNLMGLNVVFVVSLVISNVITGRLFATGLVIFDVPVALPGALFCYAITYLATDVIGEIWGRQEANRTVRWGFAGQILASALIFFTQFIPAADPAMDAAYDKLLGLNWVFVTASLAAYLASQSWDVYVFHRLRDAALRRHGASYRGQGRWLWNNVSTMTSQVLDTVLFIGIAFGLGFGWFFKPEMWPALAAMMLGQYVFKFAVALLDTPVFYLLTRRTGGETPEAGL